MVKIKQLMDSSDRLINHLVESCDWLLELPGQSPKFFPAQYMLSFPLLFLLLLVQNSIIPEKAELESGTMVSETDSKKKLMGEEFKTLCRRNKIKLAVLFGSRANETARPDSDWDLAFHIKAEAYNPEPVNLALLKKNLIKELCVLLQTSQVDIVILNRASPFLKYWVVKSGKPVYQEKEGDFASFASLAVRGYSDSFVFRKAGKEYLDRKSLNG